MTANVGIVAHQEQFHEARQEVYDDISAKPATERSMQQPALFCRVFTKKKNCLLTRPVFPKGVRSKTQPLAVACLFLPHSTGGIDFWTNKPIKKNLAGIVEVDETFFLESRKGNRNLNRKARKRGGKASKRGLSSEQVPVLVIVDRSGTTASTVLPAVNAETLRNAIEPIVTSDILLVSDGNNAYPPCAAAMGVRHKALNLSKGKRVRGPIHIQTVNNRHSRLKRFLTRYNGVSTKYLQNYLRWFERIELVNAPPRLCLATAIEGNRIQFLN